MAQVVATPVAVIPARVNPLLPAFTLWWREVVRFYRQPARVVGVIVSPLLFWVVIGAGFGRHSLGAAFRSAFASVRSTEAVVFSTPP